MRISAPVAALTFILATGASDVKPWSDVCFCSQIIERPDTGDRRLAGDRGRCGGLSLLASGRHPPAQRDDAQGRLDVPPRRFPLRPRAG